MARANGWVPRQHGAWFILLVPALLGWLYRLGRAGSSPVADRDRILVIACWVVGMFIFNALTLLVKAAPERRSSFVKPTSIYILIAGILGLGCVALFGWRIMWWGLFYIPLFSVVLALTAAGKERSLASGLLSTASASLFACTVYSPDFVFFASHLRDQNTVGICWVALVCFMYFGGTVFYVKTMIRERGCQVHYIQSVAWHILATLISLIGAVEWSTSWTFVAFFVAALTRAIALPLLGQSRAMLRLLKPLTLGLFEVGLTTLLCVLFLRAYIL